VLESYNEEPPSVAVATTTSYKVDPNWYSDTGATDHITSDLDCLAIHERYHGGDQVQVDNGAGCVFCILVILLLLLLLILLYCIIFFMYLIFPGTSFLFINFSIIMTYFLNIILGIFLLRTDSHRRPFCTADVSLDSTPSSHLMLPTFVMHC
jgi:hypothetical protein